MGGQACGGWVARAPEAVAEVVYSRRALEDLEREFTALRLTGVAFAPRAVAAICSAVDHLAVHPLTGRRFEGDLRELAIAYGLIGYVALYRFEILSDVVRVLAIRSQKELGFLP